MSYSKSMSTEPKKKRWTTIYATTVALKAHALGYTPSKDDLLEIMRDAAKLADLEEEVRVQKNNEGWELP